MIITALNEMKSYLEEKIQEENYLLVQNGLNDDDEARKVLPAVATGNLPHQNFNLYGADDIFFQAPYVLIGMEDTDSNMSETAIQVLIQVCCCSSTYYHKDTEQTSIPDNKAFEDCIIFLEWIKNRIIKKWHFYGMAVDGNFKIGSYNSKELTYPYSFGYVSFSLEQKEVTVNRSDLY